jgi:hypothetical protein
MQITYPPVTGQARRSRLRVFALLAALAVSWLAFPAAPGISAPTAVDTSTSAGRVTVAGVPVGWYRIRNLQRPGECVQADPATAPNLGTIMYMWPCNDSVQQRWLFGSTNPSFPVDYREVRNGTGRCLDASDRGGRLTRVIALWDCNKSANQAWAFSEPPSVGVACVHKAPLCDLVMDQDTNNFFPGKGYRINLWDKSGAANQTFVLEPVT